VKKVIGFFSLSLLVAMLGCSNQVIPLSVSRVQNSTVAATGWNSMTQAQKDATILSVAEYFIGSTNGNCKLFVDTVVGRASNKVVTIPGTDPNKQYFWYNDPSGHVVNRNITDITKVGSMDIIQMYIYLPVNGKMTWTPHTTINVSSDGNQMTWIDANWTAGKVTLHYVTFAQFKTWVSYSGAGFTVYHIQ
jgi:uncharacterized protein (UPF0333 family)